MVTGTLTRVCLVVLCLGVSACSWTQKQEVLAISQPETGRLLRFTEEHRVLMEGAWTTLYYEKENRHIATQIVHAADMPSEFLTECKVYRWLDPNTLEMSSGRQRKGANATVIVRNRSQSTIPIANVRAGYVRMLALDFSPASERRFNFILGLESEYISVSIGSGHFVGKNFRVQNATSNSHEFLVTIDDQEIEISSTEFSAF